MVMPANETCEDSLLVSQSARTARSGKLRFLYSVYDLIPNDLHCWREGNLMAIIAIQSCIFFEAASLKTPPVVCVHLKPLPSFLSKHDTEMIPKQLPFLTHPN